MCQYRPRKWEPYQSKQLFKTKTAPYNMEPFSGWLGLRLVDFSSAPLELQIQFEIIVYH